MSTDQIYTDYMTQTAQCFGLVLQLSDTCNQQLSDQFCSELTALDVAEANMAKQHLQAALRVLQAGRDCEAWHTTRQLIATDLDNLLESQAYASRLTAKLQGLLKVMTQEQA